MRRHAKATFAGSTQHRAGRLGRIVRGAFATRGAPSDADGMSAPSAGAAALAPRRSPKGLTLAATLAALMSLGALVVFVAPALGATVTDRPLLFKFNGADTTAGAFEDQRSLEVEQSSGDVYVVDSRKRVVDKFNATGAPQEFAGTGRSSVTIPTPANSNFEGEIAIDNSGVNPGRLYFTGNQGNPIQALDPSGNQLWEIPFNWEWSWCAAAVDSAGHLWTINRASNQVREYDSSGSPPAQIGSFQYTSGGWFPCSLDFDSADNLYIASNTGVHKYVSGVYSSTLDPGESRGVAVDRSSAAGHIFVSHNESFNEYEPSGTLVGTFGKGVLSSANGIAYNHALNRVYVTNYSGHSVYAFGPVVTGTVPDVAAEAATEVGVSKAVLHGKVNPQSVPNVYFFEWKPSPYSYNWGEAKSSAPQPLPEDNLEHPVSFNVTGLEGNRTYQARVVGLNTSTGLRAASSPVNFTTAKAAAAPAITIAAPSAVTTTSAEVTGTVNPQEDFGTTWRVQTSTSPTCASNSFSDRPTHNLDSEASSPAPVSEVLTGLLPSQHYCVRIAAVNSFSSWPPATSEIKEFNTLPAAPSGVETTFVAPRTDTTARINGRANPEGEVLTYHFEFSEDGGATWTVLGNRTDTSEERHKLIFGEELTGLEPETTYSYRFVAENPEGQTQGAEETFTTRATEAGRVCTNALVRAKQHTEYLPDCRGIELINNPEKGNQNVGSFYGEGSVSEDGEQAFWGVAGGAPGSPTGATSFFLAVRGPSGWQSTPLAPPANQQVGGGNWGYQLASVTPDFTRFIAVAYEHEESRLVRLDRNHNQEVLAYAPHGFAGNGFGEAVTEKGDHYFYMNRQVEPNELEDVGNGEPGEVITIMPDGTESECGLGAEGQSFQGWSNGRSGAGRYWESGYHSFATTDGSRVYFEVHPNGNCGGHYGLYERNLETQQTTVIDLGVKEESEPYMIRATPDGRHAYFGTRSQLDPADTNNDEDIYRWDEETGESTCLTCVVPDAKVQRVKISDDFSHIYFVSGKVLAPGASTGQVNIYVLSGGAVRFVADATSRESRAVEPSVWGSRTMAADGSAFVFENEATRRLTADVLAPEPCEGRNPSEPKQCEEVYRYDDQDGSIECISCLRGGVTTYSGYSGEVSADGSTITFKTKQALVPEDVNREADVYEWRNGNVHLITDGVSQGGQSEVGHVDNDGSDILFTTVQPGLTGFEADGLRNAYDARINGGFLPPSPPAHCTEDSCQGPLQAAPALDQSSTSTYSGPGNFPPQKKKPCAGKRRKAGRCHGKHRRRTRKARAHRNAGEAK